MRVWAAMATTLAVAGFTLALVLSLGLAGSAAQASALGGAATILWVDPINGDDANSGAARGAALATISEAWRRIPAGIPLGDSYRIRLVAGDYSDALFPLYWEDRHGSAAAPVVIEAADGPLSARLAGFVNLYNVEHVTFQDISFVTAGDVFHCEQCRHLALRGVKMDGQGAAHETIKVNQSQFITVANSDIAGAYENAIDFVAVQYAWITDNRIHDGEDWCAYVKGGSAYITVAGNEIYDCGTGGFTAGQGTGFEYMTSPWLHYETYDIRVYNNVIHDTDGAGLGVNGGYNILLAYNTLYRVGARSHVLEVVFGLRTCDGAVAGCAARQAAGGWGTTAVGAEEPIPNRSVFVLNNLIANPAPYQSQWQHLAVYGPRQPGAGSNIPNPARTDDNLVFAGNILWNGPLDHPLGVGGDACQDANPTCNTAQLLAENSINLVQPLFVNAAGGDWRLANAAALPTPVALPSFPTWDSFTPPVPAGSPINAVPTDKDGQTRSGNDQVGALAADPPLVTATPTSAATPTPTATATATATLIVTRVVETPVPTPENSLFLPSVTH